LESTLPAKPAESEKAAACPCRNAGFAALYCLHGELRFPAAHKNTGGYVMACFLAPAAEAIVVTAIQHHFSKKEVLSSVTIEAPAQPKAVPFSHKLGWLSNLLWGGSFLLMIEHVWHGEVVFYPPFLTAMENPADIQPMLMEIATAGVSMAAVVTAAWCVMLLVSAAKEKKLSAPVSAKEDTTCA
jgi:hypothetical protein